MSKREKLLLRFRNNPKFVRFEEIDSLLLRLGFEKRQTGSHATYTFGQQSNYSSISQTLCFANLCKKYLGDFRCNGIVRG